MGVVTAAREMRTIKRLLTQAETEARAAGEERPGPEHLLLAATTLPDGSASRALHRVGIDPEQLRAAVDQAHDSALAAVGIETAGVTDVAPQLRGRATGAFRATPQAQQVFHQAAELSRSTKPSRLLGAHVVAAACDVDRGTLVRALTVLGVDRDRLREAAQAEAPAT